MVSKTAPLDRDGTAVFRYGPLQASEEQNTIRLLRVDPPSDDVNIISCTISQVTFRERPQYEALSYMWGDQPATVRILLNGKDFLVRQNLWDALDFLRREKKGACFWIDAICINQDEIPERNSQVRIMPHIYQRAKTVLIWLGKEYLTLDEASWQSILEHGYWDRVWIIQEVGKARHLEICFLPTVQSWKVFIEKVQERGPSTRGPMKLHRQLEAKYNDGHTLRRLLEMHKHALCKIPHDKIYGLIGLATDCYDFPVDYGKSLFDVWKDTVFWVVNKSGKPTLWETEQGGMSTGEIISFGRLVKETLGDDEVGIAADLSLQQYIQRPYLYTIDEDNADAIVLPAIRLGTLLEVGPAPEAIISSPDETGRWTAKLQKTYGRSLLGSVNFENDQLINALFDSREPNFTEPFHIPSRLRWAIQDESSRHDIPGGPIFESNVTHGTDRGRLCSIDSQAGTWRLGFVPSDARPRDLILRVDGTAESVILRIDDDSWGQVIGIVKFAADVFPDIVSPADLANHGDGPRTKDEFERFVISKIDKEHLPASFEAAQEVVKTRRENYWSTLIHRLCLDAETLYALVCTQHDVRKTQA